MSGDIFWFISGREERVLLNLVEAKERNAIQHSTGHRTAPQQRKTVPHVISAEVEKPVLDESGPSGCACTWLACPLSD